MEILFIVIAGVAVFLLVMSVKTVRQGEEWTVERFGRYTKTLSSGLHFINPITQRIGAKVNIMERVLDVPTQEVITRDNAMVTVDGVVFYQVLDVAKATYEIANLKMAIMNLTMTNLRTVVGSMELDELLSQRGKINTQLLSVVDLATQPWGVKVNRIDIRDIQPPQEMIASMGRVMAAERQRRALVTEAEGFREAAIKKAEGEKSATILAAEGRKESAFRDAEARERSAEAEAKATEMVNNAVSKGDGRALNYFIAQQYVGALKSFANSPNQKILMMPVEAAGVIGSIAGITELAREALGKSGSGGGGDLDKAYAGTSRLPGTTAQD